MVEKKKKYRAGNLVFDCKEDYKCLKYIDDHIYEILESIEEGNVSEKVANKLKRKIRVKEYIPGGKEYLGELFPNMEVLLLSFNKVAMGFFFDMIKVKEYSKYPKLRQNK